MSTHDRKPDRDEQLNERLGELLRSTRDPMDEGDFKRPDEATINAYIDGTATSRQKQHVRRAMLESESFQSEINEILQGLEDLADPDLMRRADSITVPTALTGAEELNRAREQGFAEWLSDVLTWLTPPRLATASVALALVVTFGWYVVGPNRWAADGYIYLNETFEMRGDEDCNSVSIPRDRDEVVFVVKHLLPLSDSRTYRLELINQENQRIDFTFEGILALRELGDDERGYPMITIAPELLRSSAYDLVLMPTTGEFAEDERITSCFSITD